MDLRLPLLKLRSEVRYTINRLQPRSWGKAWVALFEAELKNIDTLTAAETKLADSVEDAEAAVDVADATLDLLAKSVARSVRGYFIGDPRELLMEQLFGPLQPNEFVRPILSSQLTAMTKWPALLKPLAVAELRDLGTAIEAAILVADTAAQDLRKAENTLAAFRGNVHYPQVQKLEGMRQSLLGEARKQAALTGRPEDAGLFMSHNRRRRPPETIERIRTEITEREQDLASSRTRLAELEAEAKARDEEAARRLARESELAGLVKSRNELETRIEALQDELEKDPKR